MFDKELVLHIAKLSRLDLSEEEVTRFTVQLDSILEYVERLESAPVEEVDVPDTFAEIHDAMRDDLPVPSLDHSAILQNGPSVRNQHFAVPKVIE